MSLRGWGKTLKVYGMGSGLAGDCGERGNDMDL